MSKRYDTYRNSTIASTTIEAMNEAAEGISELALANVVRKKFSCTSYKATEILYHEINQAICEQSNYSLAAGSPTKAATYGTYAVAVIALSVSIRVAIGSVFAAFLSLFAVLLGLWLIGRSWRILKEYDKSLGGGDLSKLTKAREALALWLMKNGSQD